MPTYNSCFTSGVLLSGQMSAPWEVLNSGKAIRLHSFELGQFSDAQDENEKILEVTVKTCVQALAASGTVQVPVNLQPCTSGQYLATSLVKVLNGALNSSGTPVIAYASSWNCRMSHIYMPPPEDRPVFPANSIIRVELSAPGDPITMNGTLTFEEVG